MLLESKIQILAEILLSLGQRRFGFFIILFNNTSIALKVNDKKLKILHVNT